MSQTSLSEKLGVSFQQIQKYEKGANRVSASSLHEIAAVIGCSVSSLFPGTGAEANGKIPQPISSLSLLGESDELIAFLATKECLRLNQAFSKVNNKKTRRILIDLVRALA